MKAQTEKVTPLAVRDGDILYVEGYRVMACLPHIDENFPERTARYTLISATNEDHPIPLPATYEGMGSGGNQLATVVREITRDVPFGC